MVTAAIVAPPLAFAPFSPTRFTSLSKLKVKIVSPLKGRGSLAESLAREDLPLTRFTISVASVAGNREPLDNVLPILFIPP
jgi:hypothetical protein